MKKRAKWNAAIRRECRGLLVCSRTGRVIARRFHKFFNVHELQETSIENMENIFAQELEKGNILEVTDKLDGSLVSPFVRIFFLNDP